MVQKFTTAKLTYAQTATILTTLETLRLPYLVAGGAGGGRATFGSKGKGKSKKGRARQSDGSESQPDRTGSTKHTNPVRKQCGRAPLRSMRPMHISTPQTPPNQSTNILKNCGHGIILKKSFYQHVICHRMQNGSLHRRKGESPRDAAKRKRNRAPHRSIRPIHMPTPQTPTTQTDNMKQNCGHRIIIILKSHRVQAETSETPGCKNCVHQQNHMQRCTFHYLLAHDRS